MEDVVVKREDSGGPSETVWSRSGCIVLNHNVISRFATATYVVNSLGLKHISF